VKGLVDWANMVVAMTAVAALMLNAASFWSDSRSRDTSSYLHILDRFKEIQRMLKETAWDEGERKFAIMEHANFLEGMALLINSRRIGGATARLSKDLLVNHLAALEAYREVWEFVEEAITAEDTFEELRKFHQKHKRKIEEQAELLKARAKI
jgi:hypothetical protein